LRLVDNLNPGVGWHLSLKGVIHAKLRRQLLRDRFGCLIVGKVAN
jgi:hypothetical protein